MKFSKTTFYLLLLPTMVAAQSGKIRVQLNIAPKLTVNNNTGISGASNAQDGKSALAPVFDYCLKGVYRINSKTQVMLGVGRYAVGQVFKPLSTQFGNQYKGIYQNFNFFAIPLSIERSLYKKRKFNVLGGLNFTLLNDAFTKVKYAPNGYLDKKKGSVDSNFTWSYYLNYYNLKTFNLLYGFSVIVEYRLNKRLYASSSIQAMQGFRPLITSELGIEDGLGNVYNPTISTTNGQSIAINVGLTCDF